jgi:hypothetical protein
MEDNENKGNALEFNSLAGDWNINPLVKTGEAYYQFGDNEPVKFAELYDHNALMICLKQTPPSQSDPSIQNSAEIRFADAKGNLFRLFIKDCF